MARPREKELVSFPGENAVNDATHPENRCPRCGHKLDRASGVNSGSAPATGDLSVCIQCGELLIFLEDLRIRSLSPAEFEELEIETKALLVKTQLVMRAARRTFGRN